MVSKFDKYFLKLSFKQRAQILEVFKRIETDGLNAADVKPLKGTQKMYRVRIGRLIRIIFTFDSKGKIQVINGDNRDSIYK